MRRHLRIARGAAEVSGTPRLVLPEGDGNASVRAPEHVTVREVWYDRCGHAYWIERTADPIRLEDPPGTMPFEDRRILYRFDAGDMLSPIEFESLVSAGLITRASRGDGTFEMTTKGQAIINAGDRG